MIGDLCVMKWRPWCLDVTKSTLQFSEITWHVTTRQLGVDVCTVVTIHPLLHLLILSQGDHNLVSSSHDLPLNFAWIQSLSLTLSCCVSVVSPSVWRSVQPTVQVVHRIFTLPPVVKTLRCCVCHNWKPQAFFFFLWSSSILPNIHLITLIWGL